MCDYEELPLNTWCYITGVQLNHVREQSVDQRGNKPPPEETPKAAIMEKRRGKPKGKGEGRVHYEDFTFSYTLT